jgi:hypothetical protein
MESRGEEYNVTDGGIDRKAKDRVMLSADLGFLFLK